MKTIANRFKVGKSWPGHVVPRVKMIITKTELEMRGCAVTPAGKGVFEVLDGSEPSSASL